MSDPLLTESAGWSRCVDCSVEIEPGEPCVDLRNNKRRHLLRRLRRRKGREVLAEHRWAGWLDLSIDTDAEGIGEHVIVWRETRTVCSAAELDALPPGAVVRTAGPNVVPGVALWTMMGDLDEPGGPWWLHKEDDAFRSDDVLCGYGSALVLWLPTDEAGA